MKRIIALLVVVLALLNCTLKQPTTFTEKALNDTFLTLENESIPFKDLVKKYKGKKVLINVWASWCRDCIEALPQEKKLQKEFSDVVFMHLSLDRNIEDWKIGIERLGLEGEHYFMQSGWKGDFGDFLNLNWIPRYLVIDEEGDISLFKATKPNDKALLESLKK